MRLSRIQAIHKYKYSTDERFFQKLLETKELCCCMEEGDNEIVNIRNQENMPMVEYVNNKKEPSAEQFDVCDNNVLPTKIIENNVEHLSNKELIESVKKYEKDRLYSDAYNVLEILMKRGHVEAYALAAYYNYVGFLGKQDVDKAYELAYEKIQYKNPYALYVLGECMLSGCELNKRNEGIKYVEEAYQRVSMYEEYNDLKLVIQQRLSDIDKIDRERKQEQDHIAVKYFH